jgi:hypothetical protein
MSKNDQRREAGLTGRTPDLVAGWAGGISTAIFSVEEETLQPRLSEDEAQRYYAIGEPFTVLQFQQHFPIHIAVPSPYHSFRLLPKPQVLHL